jgi:tetratricopeptide (TPR) repeat protein
MPKPQDRSHKKRLELERSGIKVTYHGEQEPAGYRGQESSNANVSPHVQLDLSNGGIQGLRNDFSSPAPIRILTNVEAYNTSPGVDATTRSRDVYSGEIVPPANFDPKKKRRGRYDGEMAPPTDFDPTRTPIDRPPSPESQPPSLRHTNPQGSSLTSSEISNAIKPQPSTHHATDPRPVQPTGNQPRTQFVRASQRRQRPVEEVPAVVARSPSNRLQRQASGSRIHEIGAHLKELEAEKRRDAASLHRRSARQPYVSKDPRKLRITQSRSKSPVGTDNMNTSMTSTQDIRIMVSDLVPLSPHQYVHRDFDSESTHSDDALKALIPDLVKDIARSDAYQRDGKSVATFSSASSAYTLNVEAVNVSAKRHVETGEYELALGLFGQVLSMYTKKYGAVHPLVASVYHNLGIVHSQLALQFEATQQQHERQLSLECFQAAARTARDSLGRNHPNVAVSLVRIGFLLLQAQQYKNALVTFAEALRIRLEHYGSEPHGLVANLYNNLGICHLHLKRYAESQKCLDRALEIQRHILRVERVNCSREELRTRLLEVADTLCNLGGLSVEQIQAHSGSAKHSIDAEHSFTEALEIRSTVLGPSHLLVVQIQQLLERVRTAVPEMTKDPIQSNESFTSGAASPNFDSGQSIPVLPQASPMLDTKFASLSPITVAPSVLSSPKNAARRDTAPTPESARRMVTPTGNALRSIAPSISPLTSPTREMPEISGESPAVSPRALTFSPTDPPSPHHPYHSYRQQAQNMDRSKPVDAPEESKARYISDALSPPGILMTISSDSVEGNPVASNGSLESSKDKGTVGSLTAFLDELPPMKVILLNSNPADRSVPEKRRTTIRIAPHCIPTRSPPRRPIKLDETSLDDGPPLAVLSSGSESSTDLPQPIQPVMYAEYDEESCLLGDFGMSSDRAIDQLLNSSGTNEKVLNISNHEIIVVQPFGPSEADRNPKERLLKPQTAIANSWSQAVPADVSPERVAAVQAGYLDSPPLTLKPDDPAYSGSKKETFEETDNGIAPLFARQKPVKLDAKTVLTKIMLDEPEFHLIEIHAIASRYMRKSRIPEALHLFLLIWDVQREINGELHEDVGAAIHNVGLAQLRLERYEAAQDSFERAVRIRKGALGRDHPEVAVSQVKVGVTLLLLHEFDQALVAFRDALATRKRALGALHPSLARVYNNIGCVHVEFNELRDARRAFEAALDIQRNALCHEPSSGPLMFGAATTLCNLGYLYRHRDMPEKAALVLEEALGVSQIIVLLSTTSNIGSSLRVAQTSLFHSFVHSSKKVSWVSSIQQCCQPLTALQSRCPRAQNVLTP